MTRGVLLAWPLIPRVVALRPAALAVECGGAAGAGGGMAAAGPGGEPPRVA